MCNTLPWLLGVDGGMGDAVYCKHGEHKYRDIMKPTAKCQVSNATHRSQLIYCEMVNRMKKVSKVKNEQVKG